MKHILAFLGLVGSLMGVLAKDGLFRRSPSWFVQILSIELAAARVCQDSATRAICRPRSGLCITRST